MNKTSTLQCVSLHPFSASLLALALAGCAPKPTIVGKWQGTTTQQGRSA